MKGMSTLKNINLINALYQNTEMGISSIKKLYPEIKNKNLKNEMRNQLKNYKNQQDKILDLMKADNISPEKVPYMIKVMTSLGIAFNCAKNSSSEHIAEMLIQGTNMGVIKINQALNRTSFLNSKYIDDAKIMLRKEQQYIDNMKKFL